MVSSRRVVLAVAVMALAFFSLFSLQKSAPQLVFRPGVDKCAVCNMIITDVRYAAAVLEEGRWVKFDDIGCMLSYLGNATSGKVERIVVVDYFNGTIIDAEKAWYIVADPKKLWTPMSYGVVATGNYTKAVGLAESLGGRVVDWNTLKNLYKQGIIKPLGP